MQACDRCHSRKTRCDRRIPRCTACEKAGAACLHVDKLRQRNMPRAHLDNMEDQLHRLAVENQKLRRELAALRPTASEPVQTASINNDSDSDMTLTVIEGVTSDTSAVGQRPQPTTKVPSAVITEDQTTETAFTAAVGYLALKATGEPYYVGCSSGIGLARVISNIVDSQTGVSILATDLKGRESNNSNTSSTPLDTSIPPKPLAMLFVDAYFQHTHITFPLLHRPSFLNTVQRIYDDPIYYQSHPYEAFIFDMVLSIGSSNFNRFEEATAKTSTHYARAHEKVQTVLSMKGIMPLQAILLLSQHGIFSSLRDTSASIWHLVGIGVRICIEMGLHLEAKRVSSLGTPNSPSQGVVTFEEEMRRRCFWCLYNLDRIVSFTLGRPTAMRDNEITTSLPSHLDDDLFGPNRPIHHIPSRDGDISRSLSPFLHLIAIRRLSGQMLETLYTSRPEGASMEERLRIRSQFHNQIQTWKNATKSLNLQNAPTESGTYRSCFVTPEWYIAVYSNAMLLLYRPSPFLPQPTTQGSSGDDSDLQLLFTSAKTSINSYYTLHQKRRLNYSWITLHGIFIAGLAYIYSIGRALKNSGKGMPSPDYLEVIDDTRACSNILFAICERWNVARGTCELFNRLSNALIRDVITAAGSFEVGRGRDMRGFIAPPATPRAYGPGLPLAGSEMGQHIHPPSSNPNPLNESGCEVPSLDHVFIADEFRQCSGGFEMLGAGDQNFPSELVTSFSQDWPFDDVSLNLGDHEQASLHEAML